MARWIICRGMQRRADRAAFPVLQNALRKKHVIIGCAAAMLGGGALVLIIQEIL